VLLLIIIIIIVVTSAKVMFSLCLLAGLRKKNYSTAFHTEFGALDVGGGPNLDADPRTFNGILPPWW